MSRIPRVPAPEPAWPAGAPAAVAPPALAPMSPALASAWPAVAVLCAPTRAQASASAVALALARTCATRCAVAAALGSGPGAPASLSPAARRAAARLRRDGTIAAALGRLVWLALDPSVPHRDAGDGASSPDDDAADALTRADAGPRGTALEDAGHAAPEALTRADAGRRAAPDDHGRAAAASAAAAGAARAVGAPSALALPFARSAALDRVLAWHDAIVVVREPDATPEVAALVVASVAELGRPVAAMPALPRLAAHAAGAGLRAPAAALDAVARFDLAGAVR